LLMDVLYRVSAARSEPEAGKVLNGLDDLVNNNYF